MSTFADRAIEYYNQLQTPAGLPPDVSVINPYQRPEVQQIVKTFFGKFFNDNQPRVYLLGINPGRFGAGMTGVAFTSTQNLINYCGISHNLPMRFETSSRFVYQVVEAFGGAAAFYQHFFLTSLYPLPLVREGKNYNFYDDSVTTKVLWPAMADTVRKQLQFGGNRRVAVCLGRKNEKYFQKLNGEQGFFDRIVTLDHPRYIVQYRTRDMESYVDRYVNTLADCISL